MPRHIVAGESRQSSERRYRDGLYDHAREWRRTKYAGTSTAQVREMIAKDPNDPNLRALLREREEDERNAQWDEYVAALGRAEIEREIRALDAESGTVAAGRAAALRAALGRVPAAVDTADGPVGHLLGEGVGR